MTYIQMLPAALRTMGFASVLSLAACGSDPARTETTTTNSHERTSTGGDVRRSSTETREVADDGHQTVERTETTHASIPPQ